MLTTQILVFAANDGVVPADSLLRVAADPILDPDDVAARLQLPGNPPALASHSIESSTRCIKTQSTLLGGEHVLVRVEHEPGGPRVELFRAADGAPMSLVGHMTVGHDEAAVFGLVLDGTSRLVVVHPTITADAAVPRTMAALRARRRPRSTRTSAAG